MLKGPFPEKGTSEGRSYAIIESPDGGNKFGVGDVRTVTFSDEFRVGEALVSSGEYEIRHVMDGKDHVMVFHKLSGKAVDVRAKCSLEPLPVKAVQSQQVFGVNAANERVLLALVFRGEKTKHVF
jgi:hypothetical protein